MMINVTGSLSVINKVGKTLEILSPIDHNALDLRTSRDLPFIGHQKDEPGLNISLINQDSSDDFYHALNDLSDSQAITLIENGSGKHILNLIHNKELIIRTLAIQNHCFNGELNDLSSERIFRLKDIKTSPDISEIVLRTSDIAVFNMNAIRRGDQNGYLRSNTTGLTIEEACQIAKFIGASDLIENVFFLGINLNNDPNDMMACNVANLLWYVSEGVKLRNMDQNISDPENLVFSVVSEPYDKELQFVKSAESGRWWVKVPTEEGHMHMACSKRDYEMACNNEISKRISLAIETTI
ncbi:MAG: hypothetical protein P8M34_04830 [Saprospiraceae bacterium]|nr:hypothetical protein [Saprospiraceae bacterium]